MTTYVETEFLLALAKDGDWLKDRAERALEERDLVTAPYAYLEVLLVQERHEFDYVTFVSNMLELVPVANDEERQIVLKGVSYVEEGMTAFDAFHAATADTRGYPILGSDTSYEDVGPRRIPLESDSDE
jgi:uncharacterized protein YtpQ (UPF0354 family)